MYEPAALSVLAHSTPHNPLQVLADARAAVDVGAARLHLDAARGAILGIISMRTQRPLLRTLRYRQGPLLLALKVSDELPGGWCLVHSVYEGR